MQKLRERHNNTPTDARKEVCRVKGVFNYGKWVRLVDSIGNIVNSNVKNVELICYGKGIFG